MSEIYPVDIVRQGVPELGSRAQAVRIQKIPLDAASDNKEIIVKANFLWVIDASDISAVASVRFNDQAGGVFPLRRGTSIAGIDVNRLYLTNTAQAGKYVTLLMGIEGTGNFIRAVNPDVFQAETTITRSNTLNSSLDVALAATAKTLIAFPDLTRRSILINNLATNASTMRIGNINTSAVIGQPLRPGETLTLETTAAIYAYNPGAIQSLSVTSLED